MKVLGALRALAPKYTIADYQDFEAAFPLTKHYEIWGEHCDEGESTLLADIRKKISIFIHLSTRKLQILANKAQ